MSDHTHIELNPSANGIEVLHTASGERFDLVCGLETDEQIGEIVVMRTADFVRMLDRLQSAVFRYGWARACETNARKARHASRQRRAR